MGKHGASLWRMSSQLDSMVGSEVSLALDQDLGPETVKIASASCRVKASHLLGGDKLMTVCHLSVLLTPTQHTQHLQLIL